MKVLYFNIKVKIGFVFIFLMWFNFPVFTQNTIERTYACFWTRLLINQPLSKQLEGDLMIQGRTVSDPNRLNGLKYFYLISFCPWLKYKINERLKLAISPGCYFKYSALSFPTGRKVNEFNFNARLEYNYNSKIGVFLLRPAYEYRFRDLFESGNYVYNHRLRCMIRYDFPLSKNENSKFNGVFSHESFFQFGGIMKTSSKKYDQLRFYTGLSIKLNSKVSFEQGFCYIKQNLASVSAENQYAVWFSIRLKNVLSSN